MNWAQRLVREPALLLGLITASIGLLMAFGVNLTDDQAASVLVFVGALIGLLRLVLTPSNEVIAQQKPGGPVTATEKAEAQWGIRKGRVVEVNPASDVVDPEDPPAAA